MTIGNVWLGSMQMDSYAISHNFAATSSELILVTNVYNVPAVLDRVLARLNGVHETLSVWIIPAIGIDYEVAVYVTDTWNFSTVYIPNRPLFLYPGDRVRVKVTNENRVGTGFVTMNILY
ncbi:MAG: hypothetical protein K6T85_01740 [Gorillibacterium sp.]|nr:hypothetical protein [Gorillibacterium sp.]